MSSQQLDEERIFHLARKIPNGGPRVEYLDQICSGDRALRDRVEALLEVHEREKEFLRSADPESAATEGYVPITEGPGTTIGRYKLLQPIGEGGFGVVYMAEQHRPVRRKVALKLIKPGMDTAAVVARFEAERQALALMDHPNIARVLDGGATETGRPYFVMELVKGVPITEYCDKNQLPTRERLDLFMTVCHAVQHAHQKGVIHRDIKPSNVLLTLHDGQPVVKVIDFGVAKAINQQLTERTLFTAYGQMIGTPQYMSPEQAEMSGLDVDTRSDIYSLGVLLYELLTGTTPVDGERLRTVGYAEMQRIIQEEEPPIPSVRISTSGDKLTVIAKHRSVTPDQLHRQIRGDLDWIVMKSLDKDRRRRYESAGGLARDVQRFLRDDPVTARPPSRLYQVRKFVSRNKATVASALAILAVCVIGLLGAVTGWRAAERERGLAVKAQQYAVRSAADAESARTQAETIADRLRDLVELHQLRQTDAALAFALSGNLEETRRIAGNLEDLLQGLDPDYEAGTIGLFLEGVALFYRGNMLESDRCLSQALGLDPNNFMAKAQQARSLLNIGDWPGFLNRVSELLLPDDPTFHEKFFYWFAQLNVDTIAADKALSNLTEEYPESAVTHSALSLARSELALMRSDFSLAESAITEATLASRLGPNNAIAAHALFESQVAALLLTRQQKGDESELRETADTAARALAEFDQYGPGHVSIARYLELTGRKEAAVEHWLKCGFPDFVTAVFYRDRKHEEFEEAQSRWVDSPIAQLNRLLMDIDIAQHPDERSQVDYHKLLDGSTDPVFRLAVLQAVLRLGEGRNAEREAQSILASHASIALGMPHVSTPLQLIAGDLQPNRLDQQLKNADSPHEKMIGYYWLGHYYLGQNQLEEARKALQECIRSGYLGYTYQFWAQALLARLDEETH